MEDRWFSSCDMRLRVFVRGIMARFLRDFLVRRDSFLRRAILVRTLSAFSRSSASSSSIFGLAVSHVGVGLRFLHLSHRILLLRDDVLPLPKHLILLRFQDQCYH